MHTFKQLLLASCCVTSVVLCTEPQLPTQHVPQEMNSAQIRAGIHELNHKYHEITEALKKSQTEQAAFNTKLHIALRKATRTGWPFSARLITVALGAYIAWEHKDIFTKDISEIVRAKVEAAFLRYDLIMQSLKTANEIEQKTRENEQKQAANALIKKQYDKS